MQEPPVLKGIMQKARVPNIWKKAYYYPSTNTKRALHKHLGKLSPFMENFQ